MASHPPPKKSRIHRLGKAAQRIFNRVRDAILPNSRPDSYALPGTSTPDIPNESDLKAPEAKGAGYVNDLHTSTNTETLITISPPSQQPSPYPEPNTSDKLKKVWDVTWSGLDTALRLLEKSADAFPPLKSAVGGLVACLDLAQVGCGCGFNNV